ncbi:MAG: L,D-transpeptidase family protein [Prevotella sp.]|nr:L,D-transpeptidase family protein [Prevotella sp.]
MLVAVSSCDKQRANPNKDFSLDRISKFHKDNLVVSSSPVSKEIQRLCLAAGKRTEDQLLSKYYLNGGAMIWVSRNGVSIAADSLIGILRNTGQEGINPKCFKLPEIEKDIKVMRTLDIRSNDNMCLVAARIEYRLSRAYILYVAGQRFGFFNPHYHLNRLDPVNGDSVITARTRYRSLYDLPTMRPNSTFMHEAMAKATPDSIGSYLRQARPSTKMYGQLCRMLSEQTSAEARQKILVNMERLRWRFSKYADTGNRFVVVNIPAYHLYAYGPASILDMKVGVGSMKTKTPMLASEFEYMQVNPVWVIPSSILKKEVAHRAGDSAYFARNKYDIIEKSTGKKMEPTHISSAMLASGNYRVVQQGGPGNSLGRIIFRFPNNFSVYLHDTSNPGVFNRAARSVSHGCVRVAKPLDLASYLLGETDEWTMDKLRLSMGLAPLTAKGKTYLREWKQKHETVKEGEEKPAVKPLLSLVKTLGVKKPVNLYIVYFTIYPDGKGGMEHWPDVYGYDKLVWQNIKDYTL